jgi:YD repeat-containing protein
MLKLLRMLIGVWGLVLAGPCPAATTYVYDSLSRLIGVTYGNGATISYGYDAAGNMLSSKTVVATPSHALTVTKAGTGSGVVSGVGIDCGSDCTESYVSGTDVILTAIAAAGSTFTGWSGACTNAAGMCTVTMNAAQSVGATFTALQGDLLDSDFGGFITFDPHWIATNDGTRGTVAVSAPLASGQVSRMERTFNGPGYLDFMWAVGSEANVDFLRCYLDGNLIAYRSGEKDWLLETVPIPPGPHVIGWKYAKSSGTPPGTDAGRVDAVVFTPQGAGEHATLHVQAASTAGGGGRIVSSPSLLDCGAGSANRCDATLPYGEHLLFAVPAAGSTFASWSGCDAVYGTVCQVMLGNERTAIALFATGKSYEDTVQEAYVAYYGRPADLGGQQYWAESLRIAGGNLNAIIQSFGNSEEANRLFGNMSNEGTVTTLYRQVLGRDPECFSYASSCGWGWWVNELATGNRTRQTIALDLLNGAQNEDRDTVNNRVRASNAFTGQWAALNEPSHFDSLALEALWREFLSYVSFHNSSMEEAIFDVPGWAWKSVGE